MDSAVIYEAILSKVQADLLNYGYTRSGKSTLFYRYSADKKIMYNNLRKLKRA